MNDKKSSEDEFIDEGFEDEFEFGEEEAQASEPSLKTSKPGGSRKYLGMGILGVVLAFVGYFGYKFFYTGKLNPMGQVSKLTKESTTTATSTNLQPLPGQTKPSGFTEGEVKELVKQPKELPKPPSTTPIPVPVPLPTKTLPKEEVVTVQTKEIPEAQPSKQITTTVTVIPEKQRDLFAPIKIPTTPKPTSAPIPIQSPESKNVPKVVQTQPTSPLFPVLKPKEKETEIVISKEVPQPIPVSPEKPAQAPSSADLQETAQQMQKTLEAFTKLNQQMENNLNQIKYLDSYTREVSLNVEKLNAQVSAMDNRIQVLTNLANSLSKDLGKVRNEVGYVKRVIGDEGLEPPCPPVRKQRVANDYPIVAEDGIDCNGIYGGARKVKTQTGCDDIEYVVHAVIPGRAWLKSAKGQIITVIEGESLGNYGKILVIDANNGVVLTSSGIAFR